MSHDNISVDAWNPRPTTTGTEGAVDVDFAATIDGETIDGEVTLIRDHAGVFNRWGNVDHWLDGATVSKLAKLTDSTRDAAIEAISFACGVIAETASVESA